MTLGRAPSSAALDRLWKDDGRRAVAFINVAAVERNCRALRAALGPRAALAAVVKADGYGHGAATVARAAVVAGARRLCVATAVEAAELRAAGVTVPVVVLGALTPSELRLAGAIGAEVVAWDARWVDALAPGTCVHIKLDSGMGRLGARGPDAALEVAERVAARRDLLLAGAMTHFATAPESDELFEAQVARFDAWVTRLRRVLRRPVVAHAANSAAALGCPRARFDMARCGIALYGLDPFGVDPAPHGLEPAMEVRSWVAALRRVGPGESVGYGRGWVAQRATWVASVPFGYADGLPRALSGRLEVSVGGRRWPLTGTISMDSLSFSAGEDERPEVAVGDPVVVLGGPVGIDAAATAAGTIGYELVTGIGRRVPRVAHRDGDRCP